MRIARRSGPISRRPRRGRPRTAPLAKAEYVDQKYFGYPAANIKSGGRFRGVMLEGVVAF